VIVREEAGRLLFWSHWLACKSLFNNWDKSISAQLEVM